MDAGRAHLCEDLVQPLQRAVEMQFYPAGGAGHCLTSAGYREGEGQNSWSLLMIFIPHHSTIVTCQCGCNFIIIVDAKRQSVQCFLN